MKLNLENVCCDIGKWRRKKFPFNASSWAGRAFERVDGNCWLRCLSAYNCSVIEIVLTKELLSKCFISFTMVVASMRPGNCSRRSGQIESAAVHQQIATLSSWTPAVRSRFACWVCIVGSTRGCAPPVMNEWSSAPPPPQQRFCAAATQP